MTARAQGLATRPLPRAVLTCLSRARAFGDVVNREDAQTPFVVHFDGLLRNVRRYLAARDDAALDGDAAPDDVPVNGLALLGGRLAALFVVVRITLPQNRVADARALPYAPAVAYDRVRPEGRAVLDDAVVTDDDR